MEHLSQYIEADYAVLSAVLYCLGRVLKALGRFPNRLIPLTLTGCGIALACLGAASRWSEYANWAGVMFDGVVQGILCTGMSVYLNEVISHCGPGRLFSREIVPKTYLLTQKVRFCLGLSVFFVKTMVCRVSTCDFI